MLTVNYMGEQRRCWEPREGKLILPCAGSTGLGKLEAPLHFLAA